MLKFQYIVFQKNLNLATTQYTIMFNINRIKFSSKWLLKINIVTLIYSLPLMCLPVKFRFEYKFSLLRLGLIERFFFLQVRTCKAD